MALVLVIMDELHMVEIVYIDDDLVVVNKPENMLSVPGKGPAKQDCLTVRLQQRFPQMIKQPAVHRLDMATSGLMVIAINRHTHRHLSRQFEMKTIRKEYIALLAGHIDEESGEIHLPFRVDLDNRPHQIHDPLHGKMGSTLWRRLAYEKGCTKVCFRPLTGRTHQLRVHAAHPLGLGCPIIGDRLYGRTATKKRLMLHASSLIFNHPGTNNRLAFFSAAPF